MLKIIGLFVVACCLYFAYWILDGKGDRTLHSAAKKAVKVVDNTEATRTLSTEAPVVIPPTGNAASPDAATKPNLGSATPAAGGKRIALVMGNSAYKTNPLRNPKNDADDFSKALSSLGFSVINVRDGNLQQMRAAVRQFGDQLLSSDVGLVYYSGHGVEVKGKNYFIPVNADIQHEDEAADQSLDVASILEKMGTAKKSVNILIVDACRDNPFPKAYRSGARGLASMEAPSGTIIAYSTSPGKVALDGNGKNSPYTSNLIKAMEVPNRPIEIVFKEVRRTVQQETKNAQTPWENTSLSGDFYFKVQNN
jgi:uncharacterized caspase-like protein